MTGRQSGGGVGAPTTTIDVRDMLCAQALARVGQGMARLQPGDSVEIVYNAEDVRADVVVWARERGYRIRQQERALRVEIVSTADRT